MLWFEGNILLKQAAGENWFGEMELARLWRQGRPVLQPSYHFARLPNVYCPLWMGIPGFQSQTIVLCLLSKCLTFICSGSGISHWVIFCCNKHTQRKLAEPWPGSSVS